MNGEGRKYFELEIKEIMRKNFFDLYLFFFCFVLGVKKKKSKDFFGKSFVF